MQREMILGCNEHYAELCALSTAGGLSSEEDDHLKTHLATCAQCSLLMNQYSAITENGMAILAGDKLENAESLPKLENSGDLKAKLFAKIDNLEHPRRLDREAVHDRRSWFLPSTHRQLAGLAAAVVLAMGIGFLLGSSRQTDRSRVENADSAAQKNALSQQLEEARSSLALANRSVSDNSTHTGTLEIELSAAEKNSKELREAKEAVELRLHEATAIAEQKTESAAALASERDALTQKLRASEAKLESVRQELNASREEQQKALLLTASLQMQVDRLSEDAKDREQAMHRDEQYLASDRDVRELMGARQLYIADVFDVDPQGQTKKPFGRVFYTKGRSLIFYAFDLDQQPGYKDAKAFQVWGKPGSVNTEPINLGIFYLDNEKNRRWALKFENAKILEEINSLFVTVEPKGGSRKPTNKPFLVAYLHSTAPNHP